MNLFSDWSKRAASYFGNFPDKINDITSNYTSLIGLLGIAIIIVLLFKFKKDIYKKLLKNKTDSLKIYTRRKVSLCQ